METSSTTAIFHSLSFPESVGFLFFHTVFVWVVMVLQMFLPAYLSLLLSYIKPFRSSSMVHDEKKITKPSRQHDCNHQLTGEDVKMIIGRMGLNFSQDDEQLKGSMDFEEFSNLFEEEEPSFQEMKEAFIMFDENDDGFIDAMELQRVLPKLGFREGTDLQACRQMIMAYDINHDGRINFIEFVKLLESSFC
ncbi:probable calcium-binding protein CML46 [Typha latifolia]|uniref:probable calcium-binding protein CML46 n=1 Tax=Typha latifolia TaxID=4733 RepID=UPI003C2C1884